jgi:hypothetical protein
MRKIQESNVGNNGVPKREDQVSDLRILTNVTFVFAAFSILLAASGISYLNSAILCTALFIQWFPGAVLWSWINKNRINSTAELLGMGLAIGTLLALISSQIFRTTNFQRFSWAIPAIFLGLIGFWIKGSREKLLYTPKSTVRFRQVFISLFPTIFMAIIQLSIWWRWHPISWQGWWKYNIDVPYFESYSNSIAILGTTESLMNPEQNSRYHWFTYAWVGSLSNSLDADAFVVLTRLLPVALFCMMATIAYAWAKDYSEKFWTPALAAFVVTTGPGLSVGSFVMLRSPSLAMAGCWCLAFSLLMFRVIHGSATGIGAYSILALFAAGVVGGKASNLPIFASGTVALLLISFRQTLLVKNRTRISALLSLAVFVFIFQKLIASPEARALDFGIFLGWPGLILTILPLTMGIYGLSKQKTSDYGPLFVYSLSILTVGSLLSFCSYDPTGNQLYFVISAALVCVVPSLIGIEKMNSIQVENSRNRLREDYFAKSRIFVPIFILVGGLSSSTLWASAENENGNFGEIVRTIAPIPLWILSMLLFIKIRMQFRPNKMKVTRGLRLLFISVLSTSLVASVSGILISTYKGPIYSGSSGPVGFGKSVRNIPGSISPNYLQAGKWVQENIKTTNLFFTNRQCVDPKSSYIDCNSYWFYASALSKQQFLIEGAALSNFTGTEVLKMTKEQAVSYRFSLSPNQDDLKVLWERNVRWGWIDRQVSDIVDWKGLANEIYSNDDIAIIELIEPKN